MELFARDHAAAALNHHRILLNIRNLVESRHKIGVCREIAGKRKPALVVVSSFASENTKDKIIAKCDHYGVSFVLVALDGEELARRVGKSGFTATVAITDPGLAREIANACTCKGRESPTDGDGSMGNRG